MKNLHIIQIRNDEYLVNRTLVTIYRDMDGDVMTNPRLEPDELALLRQLVASIKVKPKIES